LNAAIVVTSAIAPRLTSRAETGQVMLKIVTLNRECRSPK
jgi:hypothetical protein